MADVHTRSKPEGRYWIFFYIYTIYIFVGQY